MRSRLRFLLPVFTATRVVINTLFRMVYPFLPVISRGLGISFEQAARALSLRSIVGVFGPFFASVADSRGRRFGMLFGLSLYALGLLVVVFWPTTLGFILTLVLTTLGKFSFDPSMQAYLGDRVAYQRRSLVLALTEFGWSGAFFLGVPAMAFLIARLGWLAPFPLLAALAGLSFLILAWMLPADQKPALDRPSLMQNFGTVFAAAPALVGLSLTLLVSIANEVVNLVFGVWLEDSFGLQVAAIGAASAVIGLSELSGEGLVGFLTDKLGKKRAVGVGLLCNSLAAAALPFLGQTVPGALVGLFLFYLSFEFTVVSSIPMMTEVLPKARATLMAMNSASASLGRAAAAWLAPSLYRQGFLVSALAAGAINILAMVALRFIAVEENQPSK